MSEPIRQECEHCGHDKGIHVIGYGFPCWRDSERCVCRGENGLPINEFRRYTDNQLIEELIERGVIEVCADDIFGANDLIYVYRIDRLAAEEHERFVS